MKITAITPMVLGTQWRNLVIVKVETDEGIVGVGESRPINKVDAAVGYVKDVADYLACGRVAGRYVISVGDMAAGLSVITLVAACGR